MPTYAPDLTFVTCRTGAGVTVTLPNSALWGRTYTPQPFLRYLDSINLTDTIFPDGFIGQPYLLRQTFTGSASVSVVAGALPPGIELSEPTPNEVELSGIPTTLGTYTFTIRFTVGLTASDYIYHITILPDPDEGIGVVGGG